MATGTDVPAWLACEERLWLRRDGAEARRVARVGVPYAVDARTRACAAGVEGHRGRVGDIFGGSSMQSLCLAIALVRTQLAALIEQGERLVHPDDRDVAWDPARVDGVFGTGGLARRGLST